MNMELVFPGDAGEARARSDRNLSDVERWASIAAGAGLAAYGLSRLRSNGWLYAGLGGLLLRRGVTAHCDLYEAVGINTAGTADDTRAALRGSRGVNVLESVTISHWRAKGPAGTIVEWDAEVFNEVPPKLIAWRSNARSCRSPSRPIPG